MEGHAKAGPLTVEYINRGNIVLFHLPSFRTRIDGRDYNESALLWYFPLSPKQWGGGWTRNEDLKWPDFIDETNAGIGFEGSRPQRGTPERSGPPYVGIATSREEQKRLSILDRKYPECQMHPLPPEPVLTKPLERTEICRIQRDWSEVKPAPEIPLAPDSPVKLEMVHAIIRAVARATSRDPGRNQIVVQDFNVDDQETPAALLSPAGRKLDLLDVRLDKSDPCFAAAHELGASYNRDVSVKRHIGLHLRRIYP